MNEKDSIYLARIFSTRASERFEDMLLGKKPDHIGTNDEEFPKSGIADTYRPTKEAYKTNYENLQKCFSYFVIGNDLEAIAEETIKVAHEPNNQHTYDILANGSEVNRENDPEIGFKGDDRVTMVVVEIPKSLLNRLTFEGKIAKCTAEYGIDTEKSFDEEYILSDDALKELYNDGYIMHFGNTHKVMAEISSTPFDKEDILDIDKDYRPEITIHNFNKSELVAEQSYDDDTLEDDSIVDGTMNDTKFNAEFQSWYNAYVEIMKSDMSQADQNLMLEALYDALPNECIEQLKTKYNQEYTNNGGYGDGM